MADSEHIPPTRQALVEALVLSTEILRNLEMSEIPLSNVALRTARLARLLNDFDWQRIMEYEVGGYPCESSAIPPEAWRLAGLAGRYYKGIGKDHKPSTFAYIESIGQLEEQIRTSEAALAAASDRNISITSANPHQYVHDPVGNQQERVWIRADLNKVADKLASRRSVIYSYVLRNYYELKFSGTADDIFSRTRNRVDSTVKALVPDAVQRFNAVYDNLISENPEDWSNAVHSCRRILQDLADVLFTPTEPIEKIIDGKTIKITLGKDQYINRIMAFIEQKSTSKRFVEIVGSELRYLGNRLDAIFRAVQKGSHETILGRDEADRYVIYTYLMLGDLLTLFEEKEVLKTEPTGEA
jgi:hypothetical protein